MEGVSVLVPGKLAMSVLWLSHQQNGTPEGLSVIVPDICPYLNEWFCLMGFIERTLWTPALVNFWVFISPHVYAQ